MTEAAGRWREALRTYSRPQVLAMVWLGFSAGLPFLLIGPTLSAWQRDVGVQLTVIAFFSWVGVLHSVKVLWAPLVDRLPLPLLTRWLGQRRSWMLLSQLLVAGGLLGMAGMDPARQLAPLAALALLVGFGSATQDITVDAWRIEALDPRYQGAMAAAYVFGYRVALLVAGAGALYIADAFGWSPAYLSMAALMSIGVIATLVIDEPGGTCAAEAPARRAALVVRAGRFLQAAIIAPFREFFARNGREALMILLLIALYKLSDTTMGVMANPFYLDLGFSKTEIAEVTKVFGFFMTIAGAALGGVLVVGYGIARPLLLGAVLVAATNLLFVLLALVERDLVLLAVVVSADNLSGGIATSVLIAYLSGLTNKAYTATQYALFSSLMTLPARLIGGFAGVFVDAWGYALFFLAAGLLGVPAALLALRVVRQQRDAAAG